MQSQLEKLQLLLEGKTVLKVEDPNASEAICKITLSDGTSFRLHATDLGFWIEQTSNVDGKYNSLTSLLIDYSHNVSSFEYKELIKLRQEYDNNIPANKYYQVPNAIITMNNSYCKFVAPDGREFLIDKSKLSDYEISILKNKKGLKMLSEAAYLGDAWVLLFNKSNKKCPAELRYKQ